MTLMDDATGVSSIEKARLIELAQGGDRNAFTTLFQWYHTRICTYLGRLVENEELGRDLAQETFVQAWQQLPHLRDTRSFEAWLGSDTALGISSSVDRVKVEKQEKGFEQHERLPAVFDHGMSAIAVHPNVIRVKTPQVSWRMCLLVVPFTRIRVGTSIS